MVPLVYHPAYNITAFGLEKLHPFDSIKYARIHAWLIRHKLRRAGDFVEPRPCTQGELLNVHTPDYLATLKQRLVLARILEVGVVALLPASVTDQRVLRPMRWATGGTILACRLARERGLAINLGGGYHHAGATFGGGFCAYADVPLALALLHRQRPFRSVLVVDTDAHQGNGSAAVFRGWPWAHQLDLYEADIFPWPKVAVDLPVPLPAGTNGPTYLQLLRKYLPMALDELEPELVVYNAGSDVLYTDPLAHLALTDADLVQRDRYVVAAVRERGIPLAMVLSGGYGPHSWLAHARSIAAILNEED